MFKERWLSGLENKDAPPIITLSFACFKQLEFFSITVSVTEIIS